MLLAYVDEAVEKGKHRPGTSAGRDLRKHVHEDGHC